MVSVLRHSGSPRRISVVVATGMAVALTWSAVGTTGVAAAVPEDSIARGDVGSSLRWRDCPTPEVPTLQCASLAVPMNYQKPQGRRFVLAVVRAPATGKKKIGTLFFNPGGPGGSGTATLPHVVPTMSDAVRSKFDIVSWDPRGVGETTPQLRNCAQPGLQMPTTTDVDWAAVQREAARTLTAANRACQRSNKSFINKVGTNNVARDLDRLRAAVGDKKLTFWGASYGTHVGYVYATMFPGRIRALVLDGNMTPFDSFKGVAVEGGLAPDTALSFMKNNYPEGYAAITNTAEELTGSPIDLGEGVTMSRWTWLQIMNGAVGSQKTWPQLPRYADLVAMAREDSEEGAAVREGWRAVIQAPNPNAGGVFSAVECIDYPQRLSNAVQTKITTRNAANAPWFGGMLTLDFARGCSGFDLKSDPIPLLTSAKNRARIASVNPMISNATHDAATPMLWAKQMSNGFGVPVRVRYRSGQHVVWNFVPSACINKPIDRYVLTGKQPGKSRTCAFLTPQLQDRSRLRSSNATIDFVQELINVKSRSRL